jgi:hypothetical protein
MTSQRLSPLFYENFHSYTKLIKESLDQLCVLATSKVLSQEDEEHIDNAYDNLETVAHVLSGLVNPQSKMFRDEQAIDRTLTPSEAAQLLNIIQTNLSDAIDRAKHPFLRGVSKR